MKMGIFNRFLGSEEKKSIVPAGFDPSLGISAEPRVWDAVISLGGTCQVAHQIKRSGMRLASYPFDWLFSTEPEYVIKAFEDDFKDFLKYENLDEAEKTETEHKRVTDKYYHMIHQHIFPLDEPIADSYASVKEIVDRRVRRLLSLQGKNMSILFIRTDLTEDQALRLGDLLHRKYGKSAHLLVVNHIKEFKMRYIPLNSEYISMFEIYDENENTGQRWQGYDPHWDVLLGNMKVREFTADLRDETLFEGIYGYEKDEQGRGFRWTFKETKFHIDRFGGCRCTLKFDCPKNTDVELLDHNGKVIASVNTSKANSFTFDIVHETREVTLRLGAIWRPCDVFGVPDERELGICLREIRIRRLKN